jgi:hypothetical protein
LERSFVGMDESICRARPPSKTRSRRKEKTAEAIQAEVAREATNLLGQIFAERKQTGSLDLEAVEMGFRAALHQAGAAALSQLLPFAEPCAEQRDMGYSCGHRARYRKLRSRPFLTVLGGGDLAPMVPVSALPQRPVPGRSPTRHRSPRLIPWGCAACRLWVGQESPFDHGREQIKTLAWK